MAKRLRDPDRRRVVDAAVRRALDEGGLTFTRLGEPNVRRWYGIALAPNLFGSHDLVRAWGRYRPDRAPAKPRRLVEQFPDEDSLLGGLSREVARRLERSYRLRS